MKRQLAFAPPSHDKASTSLFCYVSPISADDPNSRPPTDSESRGVACCFLPLAGLHRERQMSKKCNGADAPSSTKPRFVVAGSSIQKHSGSFAVEVERKPPVSSTAYFQPPPGPIFHFSRAHFPPPLPNEIFEEHWRKKDGEPRACPHDPLGACLGPADRPTLLHAV